MGFILPGRALSDLIRIRSVSISALNKSQQPVKISEVFIRTFHAACPQVIKFFIGNGLVVCVDGRIKQNCHTFAMELFG